MLVVLDGRAEWLAFAAGAYYAAEPNLGRYTLPNRLHDAVAYGVPALVVAAGWLVRRELARREPARREPARREPARREPAQREPAQRAGGAETARSYRPVTRELNLERTGPSGS
jgi:hypothetical protein